MFSWLWRFFARAPDGALRQTEGAPRPEGLEQAPAEDPLNGELDLHTFRPTDVPDLVREYVLACREKGVLSLRIVHGKGRGTLRRSVHGVLASMPDEVRHYALAEPARGGWGATLVDLRPLATKE